MGKKVKAEPADESMDTTMKSEAPEEDNDESGGKAQKRPLPTPVTEKGEYIGEYEELCELVNGIAEPLAGRKLAKKLYKLVRKASKEKTYLRQGMHDVHKAIRRGETGLVILAGDVTPIDIYCHMGALCEDKDLPYVFTPSREHLGLAAGHRRPAILLMIRPNPAYQELLDECIEAAKMLPINA